MQYILMIHADEAQVSDAWKADPQSMMAAYGAYTQALKEAKVYVGGERLHPAASGAVVRIKDGRTAVLNGPYSEAREQLGGYYVIEAPDLDAALVWASRCPGASHGAVEVRPIWPVM